MKKVQKMKVNDYLPHEVSVKIYKTKQTRGADDDVIYQNRVSRTSTVLIPFDDFEKCKKAPSGDGGFENGYIVLIKPEDYFRKGTNTLLKKKGLVLGQNLLVFYETRSQWINYPPLKTWNPAQSRRAPLKGEFVARVPATTSTEKVGKIIMGFSSSKMKGAGIRVYEYADSECLKQCTLQLEFLFFSCFDIKEFAKERNISTESIERRVEEIKKEAGALGLINRDKLMRNRIIDEDGYTICPFCLERMSAYDFCTKIKQAEGRDVPDLTVTEASLFHIRELRTGEFNHRPYNLGWGHHHCNVVVKDQGIENTLKWLKKVLENNKEII